MKPLKKPMLLAVLSASMLTSCADAKGYGRSHNGLLCPRTYDFHRRHRQNAFDLVSDMFSAPFYSTNTLLRQQNDQVASLEHTSTPRYSISKSEDDSLVELTMEIPGVPAKDLSVEVENGSILRIKGSRILRESGVLMKTEFDQSFQLDQDIDVENISVSLSSGILTVSAPRKHATIKRISLKILESDNTDKSQNEIDGENERFNDQEETESNVDEHNGGDNFVITDDD